MKNQLKMVEFLAKNEHFINFGLVALGTTAIVSHYNLNDSFTAGEITALGFLSYHALTTLVNAFSSESTVANIIRNKLAFHDEKTLITRYSKSETNSYEEKEFNEVKREFISNFISLTMNQYAHGNNMYFQIKNLPIEEKNELKAIYDKEFSTINLLSKSLINLAKNKPIKSHGVSFPVDNGFAKTLLSLSSLNEKENEYFIKKLEKQSHLSERFIEVIKEPQFFKQFSHSAQKLILDRINVHQISVSELEKLNDIWTNNSNKSLKDKINQKRELDDSTRTAIINNFNHRAN